MDTDLQRTQQKKLRHNTKLALRTNSNQAPGSFFYFWVKIILAVLLIFTISLISGKIFSEKVGYIVAIVTFLLWVLFQFLQLQKIAQWIEDPNVKNGFGNIETYSLVYPSIARLIRSSIQQQELLNKSLAGFKRSTQAMTDGVVIIDNNDQIVVVTPRAERYLKIKSDVDTGKNIINVIRNPKFAEFLTKQDWSKSIILENLPIENRVIELQILPYDDDERLLICRDITKLKRLESSKKDFVANASYELKTPLTILGGYIETMIELPLDKNKKKSMLVEMSNQTFRMERLVNDLLTLSKLDAEEVSAVFDEICLEDIFKKITENTYLVNKSFHKINFTIDREFNLLGSHEQIFSAFWNLINNSILYTQSHGTIQISWKVNDNKVGVFKVSDTGTGIEAHHLPFISERFYRVDKSRSQKSGGSGLGLSIVKNIALKHESKLEIESKIGKGSTFKIIFPSERLKEIDREYEKNSIK